MGKYIDEPSADVVEVVRCAKCKHSNSYCKQVWDGGLFAIYCEQKRRYVAIDWHCPNGERKEEVE